MTDQKLEIDLPGTMHPGDEVYGVIIGMDGGARVCWTNAFLALPREERQQVGVLLQEAVKIVPPRERI